MEVTTSGELNIKGRECTDTVSNSYPSLRHLRSTELYEVHEREKAEECHHFTIRGYVAGVRKRDLKICWPLRVPDSQTPDLFVSLLPPLVVSRFKQWDCMNCARTISYCRNDNGNAAASNAEGKVKTGNVNTDATNSLSYFEQYSDNKTLPERVAEVDSSAKVCQGDCSSAPRSMQKDNQCSIKDMAKEGLQDSRCGHYQFRGHGAQSNHTEGLAEEDEILSRKRQQLRKRPGVTLANNNASGLVNAKKAERELLMQSTTAEICDSIPSSVRNIVVAASNTSHTGSNSEGRNKFVQNEATKVKISLELNNCIPAHTTSTADGDCIKSCNLMDLDEKNNDAPRSSMVMSDEEANHNFSELCFSNGGKRSQKKSLKLRSLEEIMRTEDSNIQKKHSNAKEHKEVSQLKSSHDKTYQIVTELEDSTCPSHFVGHKTEVTLTRATSERKEHEKIKEPSLMQWLNKASKKRTTNKRNDRTKRIEQKFAICSGITVQKTPDPQAAESKQTNCMVEKQNKGRHGEAEVVCPIARLEILASKDNHVMKFIPPYTVQPRIRSGDSNNNLHNGIGIPHKTIDTKFCKRKWRTQVEERVSSQIDQSQNESSKRQNTKSTCDQGVSDDIPAEIVELLAKNQNDRSVMHAKVAAENCLELSSENLDMMIENASSESLESKKSAAKTKHVSSDKRDCGQSVPPGNQKFQGQKFGICNCSAYLKNNLNIDLNQQAPDLMESSECVRYLPFKSHFVVSNSPQEMNTSPRNQGLQCQSASRSYPRMPSIPLVETVSGVNMIVGGSCNDAVNIGYCDPYFGRHQSAFPERNKYNEFMKLSGPQLPSAGGFFEHSSNLASLPPLFLQQEQNASHSRRLGISDLGTDDTLSAMHLLRLVDNAAITGVSSSTNSKRPVQNGELHVNGQPSWRIGLETGVRNMEAFKSSFGTGFLKDGIPGGSCKLLRPVPRIGVLGPLLQKEIMTQCDNNRMHLGCQARCSHEHLVSGCTHLNAYDPGTSPKFHSSISTGKWNVFTEGVPLRSFSPMYEMNKTRLVNMDAEVQPVRHNYTSELCVVSRNPADFTVPDEDNIYMR